MAGARVHKRRWMMTLSLTKDEDGGYLDQDGCSYDTPADWLWMGILGGCGCGSANKFADKSLKLLNHFATPYEQRTLPIWDDGWYELLAHWFDSLELIEHGGNIYGSWLTEKGQQIYDMITKALEVTDG
jgi:hypothetical protein